VQTPDKAATEQGQDGQFHRYVYFTVLTFGRLYGKFGFHPYFLTAFMAASVAK
jgi:hypothetical protein